MIQPTIPSYRVALFERLDERFDGRLAIVAGTESIDGTNSVTPPRTARQARMLSPRFLLSRRVVWLPLPWRQVMRAQVVVAELNPRTLSLWVMLGIRRMLRRPTVLWGHVWPRAGRGARTEPVRAAMRRLGTVIVTYSETQAGELRLRGSKAPVVAAPNALYPRDSAPLPGNQPLERASFLLVGRLIESKKPLLAIEAFAVARRCLPEDAQLLVVGAGPQLQLLQQAAAELGVGGHVAFAGWIDDLDRLSELYGISCASLSPGYAGLSVTQSHYFGVPILVADSEPHAPEVEAVVEGSNGLYFESDSPEDLASAMVAVWSDRQEWAEARREIAVASRSRYSIELMVDRMEQAVALALAHR